MTSRILMIVTSHNRLGSSDKATGVWAEELAVPYYMLVDAGAVVDLATPAGGPAPIDPSGVKPKGKNGAVIERFLADGSLQDRLANTPRVRSLNTSEYDAVLFPGGHGTMWDLPIDAGVTQAVEQIHGRGKIIASVCHGAAGLVTARRQDGLPIVHGMRISSFTDAEEAEIGLTQIVPFQLELRLRQLGAKFEGAPNWQPFAVRDGQFITGQNPQSSALIAQHMLEALEIASTRQAA